MVFMSRFFNNYFLSNFFCQSFYLPVAITLLLKKCGIFSSLYRILMLNEIL
jgi:hypothetical protein